jgi:hypothetical protein
MGLPRLRYTVPGGPGVQRINFPRQIFALNARRRRVGSQVTTDGGVVQYQFQRFEEIIEPEIDFMLTDKDFNREIKDFWGWVSKGKTLRFMMDPDDMVFLKLDGAAAAGQKTVPMEFTDGLVVGQRYYLTNWRDGWQRETVEVDTINAGVSFDAVDNLIYSYDAPNGPDETADRVRSRFYFPKLVVLSTRSPLGELSANRTTFLFRARSAFDTEVN